MAKYINSGESIECKESHVATRKSSAPTLLNIAEIDGKLRRLFKYKTKIRAIIKITRELTPKKGVICDNSHLDLLDELEGDTVEIFTENRIKLEVVSYFSNVHGIQGNSVNCFTYAKIVIPWRFVLEKASIDTQTLIA